jgi:hypothetical protein
MTHYEFKALWASLDEDQKTSVRLKADWEQMTLWAVCNSYPGIWNDPQRLGVIRQSKGHDGEVRRTRQSPDQ